MRKTLKGNLSIVENQFKRKVKDSKVVVEWKIKRNVYHDQEAKPLPLKKGEIVRIYD